MSLGKFMYNIIIQQWVWTKITVPKQSEALVYNSILTLSLEDQVNIVQIYQGEWNRGLMLNRDDRSGQLSVGE